MFFLHSKHHLRRTLWPAMSLEPTIHHVMPWLSITHPASSSQNFHHPQEIERYIVFILKAYQSGKLRIYPDGAVLVWLSVS